jgi:hypothetical protein
MALSETVDDDYHHKEPASEPTEHDQPVVLVVAPHFIRYASFCPRRQRHDSSSRSTTTTPAELASILLLILLPLMR